MSIWIIMCDAYLMSLGMATLGLLELPIGGQRGCTDSIGDIWRPYLISKRFFLFSNRIFCSCPLWIFLFVPCGPDGLTTVREGPGQLAVIPAFRQLWNGPERDESQNFLCPAAPKHNVLVVSAMATKSWHSGTSKVLIFHSILQPTPSDSQFFLTHIWVLHMVPISWKANTFILKSGPSTESFPSGSFGPPSSNPAFNPFDQNNQSKRRKYKYFYKTHLQNTFFTKIEVDLLGGSAEITKIRKRLF